MRNRRGAWALPALALAGALVVSACGPGATPTPVPDLLQVVQSRGHIVMSTDPGYPPQSAARPDGTYEGFDIDVGAEIAKRLGVEIRFFEPSWAALTAGSWAGRWDFSVGSMTITTPREQVLAFTTPYYYTPAQMAVQSDSAIQSVNELAGKAICVGGETTYQEWLEGGLDLGSAVQLPPVPAGATAVPLSTDRNCAEAWQAGRQDFEAWLSSSTTVQGAIDAGLPVRAIGDPIYFEPLAVAFDRSGPDPTSMVQRVNQILQEMRQDGTLARLSEKWFDTDLTKGPQG